MIKIVKGDITTLEVDAIVNAANEMMLSVLQVSVLLRICLLRRVRFVA